MCIGMIDTDSSCDHMELVELNSMVELVSLSEGEIKGPVTGTVHMDLLDVANHILQVSPVQE